MTVHPSPFDDFPGRVLLPKNLSPVQFLKWYENTPQEKDDADTRPGALSAYEARRGFVLRIELKGVPEEATHGDGRELPAMKIVQWVNQLTGDLLRETMDPKELRGK